MEKIKEAVGIQLESTESAIIEALASQNVQMYIVTINSLRDMRFKMLEEMHQGEVSKDTRRKLVTLKKGKEILENYPEVKAYLAFLSKHAQLSDSYRQLENAEFSRK